MSHSAIDAIEADQQQELTLWQLTVSQLQEEKREQAVAQAQELLDLDRRSEHLQAQLQSVLQNIDRAREEQQELRARSAKPVSKPVFIQPWSEHCDRVQGTGESTDVEQW